VAESKLQTYTVSGGDLQQLAIELAKRPGVDSVAPFGTVLDVSGRDVEKLEAAITSCADFRALQFSRSAPSLEHVFIDLMTRAKDNFQ
jgi:ABC-2 type transport system ATP-binding protein